MGRLAEGKTGGHTARKKQIQDEDGSETDLSSEYSSLPAASSSSSADEEERAPAARRPALPSQGQRRGRPRKTPPAPPAATPIPSASPFPDAEDAAPAATTPAPPSQGRRRGRPRKTPPAPPAAAPIPSPAPAPASSDAEDAAPAATTPAPPSQGRRRGRPPKTPPAPPAAASIPSPAPAPAPASSDAEDAEPATEISTPTPPSQGRRWGRPRKTPPALPATTPIPSPPSSSDADDAEPKPKKQTQTLQGGGRGRGRPHRQAPALPAETPSTSSSSSDGDDEDDAEPAKQPQPSRGGRGRGRPRAQALSRGRGRGRATTSAACRKQDASPEEDPVALGQKLLQLVQEQADEAGLKEMEADLPVRHFNEKSALNEYHAESFLKWRLLLRQGFSLLFYGLGSKLKLLETFGASTLTDGGVLALNGFNPRLNARQVVQAAASAYFGKSCRGSSTSELITQLANESGERSLYLLLHNIDGSGLHSTSDQALLAELASCRCIHLAASVDHVNAPVLWSMELARQFNWLWLHTPTYHSCSVEALDTPSILAGWGHQSRRRGASTVLHSLVPNARHVFKIMANVLLEDPACEGLSFAHWYRLCRERFLVATEQALRGHLTEFKDHELVKTRTNSEGLDVLYIPLETEALTAMLQELEQME